jgi:hypothetical protein
LATAIFAQMWSNFDPNWQHSWHTTWLDIGSEKFPFKLEIGVRIDNLAAIMLFMVILLLCIWILFIYPLLSVLFKNAIWNTTTLGKHQFKKITTCS